MKGFLRLLLTGMIALSLAGCASTATDDDFFDTPDVASDSGSDAFDDLDDPGMGSESAGANVDAEFDLEEEFEQAQSQPSPEAQASNDFDAFDDFDDFDQAPENQAAAPPAAEDDPFADFDQPADSAQAAAPSDDPFADFDNEFNQEQDIAAQTAPTEDDPFANFDDEFNQAQTDQPPALTPGVSDDFAAFDDSQTQQPEADPFAAVPPPDIAADQGFPADDFGFVDPGVEAPAPVDTGFDPAPPIAASQVNIKNIRFRANDNGGTVVIDADGPLNYTTRTNPETNQFVIEITDAKLPNSLKRPFNTKDITGSIGAIDAYQNAGSTTARIVVQMREGTSEPMVQPEGNSLLLIAGGAPAPAFAEQSDDFAQDNFASAPAPVADGEGILSAQSLEEFLSGNMQFYGKPVSIETSGMDVREFFKFLSDESSINMVLSDEVRGTISLKLRQVPWDQAFILVMRARKLGYTRTGNVLRVAPLADIRAEEEDAVRAVAAKKSQSPLTVKVLPISYSRVEEITRQIQPFLSERGRIVADARTSSVVVSDLDENIERAQKLIQAIDVPPPQVLIEGKVVEASDTFQRSVGVSWGASGKDFGSGSTRGNLNFNVNPGISRSTFGLNFRIGTIDVLGDLTSTLALFERQSDIKVLSSPRIVTLHNEPANINQRTEIPIVTTTAQAAGAAPTTTVSFKPVSLNMNVTPQVTNDGAVIMTVDVNRDSLGEKVEGTTTNAQAVNSRGAKTKVLVKNGQTAVIGGIYQNDTNVSETKVPWIGDVPVIGWLFKSRGRDSSKNELLIFLTPRIIGTGDSLGSSDTMGSAGGGMDQGFDF